VTAQAIPALTRRPLPIRPPSAARAAAKEPAESPFAALLAIAVAAFFP
jgi:hypothetical protein